MKLYGNILRDARDRKDGITLKEMSDATGMSISTLSSAENENEIHQSTGRRICEFLGIDLAAAVIPRESNNGDAA